MLELHSKVVGDIASATKKIQKKNLTKIIGLMPIQQIVDIKRCVPFDYNRDTKIEWATNALSSEQGFNWQLFGSIEGIENPLTGDIEIWDGLGRLCLAQISNLQQIPVIVHKDGSPGALFVKKQKLRNRTLNQEQHFVSYVSVLEKGGIVDPKHDKSIAEELAALTACGVRVESGINNYAPKAANIATSPRIQISAIRRSLKITNHNLDALIFARNMIFKAYPTADFIGKELFEGCVFLFTASPKAMKNGTYKSLCDFLKSMNNIQQKDLPFKMLGGNQHNDEARSVALGIWEMWSKSSFAQGHPSTVLRRKHIEEFSR